MSELLVSPRSPDGDGNILTITPESARWKYVGFEVFKLTAGQSLSRDTGDQEVCLVLLGGKAHVATAQERFENIGGRQSVFDDEAPYSVYVPNDDRFQVTAVTDLELAVCKAPGKGTYPARLIRPEDVRVEDRGSGSNARRINNILSEDAAADSLLVVEVYTPEGNWSSYPPHKHDQDALPNESYLEETYYHRINPTQGFAFQRVYTDERDIDETITVHDGEVVMVPRGYHPVGAPYGYNLYYLNTMAGPVRTWKFHNDPAHEWLFKRR